MRRIIAWLRSRDLLPLELLAAMLAITAPDVLMSDALALERALTHANLGDLARLESGASAIELLVPAGVLCVLCALWWRRQTGLAYRAAHIYGLWVTVRLIGSALLLLYTLITRPDQAGGQLVVDTLVLWFGNVLVFAVWYWLIDGGGPPARRQPAAGRMDIAFPQRSAVYPGWENWQPRFLDYVYVAFSGSTQFGLGDSSVLSIRAKLLMMVQASISVMVLVFLASIAIGLIA
jgi:hypothetical protein